VPDGEEIAVNQMCRMIPGPSISATVTISPGLILLRASPLPLRQSGSLLDMRMPRPGCTWNRESIIPAGLVGAWASSLHDPSRAAPSIHTIVALLRGVMFYPFGLRRQRRRFLFRRSCLTDQAGHRPCRSAAEESDRSA
jgi:membrane-associated phospholipid phosphatase